ncbi:MAG: hypothetical protein QM628_16385 [Propionicimonas sp.]
MRALGRAIGAAVVAVLVSGCQLAWIFEEPVPPVPNVTLGPTEPPTPTPTPEPDPYAYRGKLAKGAKCRTLSAGQLTQLEQVGGVGGAITYPRGSMVQANDDWWVAAVITDVHQNSEGHTRESVAKRHLFVVGAASADWEYASGYRLGDDADDAAVRKAVGCADKLPVPKPTLEPTDPKTYTGRLAKGASCKAVSADMLGQLEQVGQVGGAVTFAGGQMVRANGDWWTVAVATQVNPNNAGLTRENVPPTELFVTNAPSLKKSSKTKVVYFPLNPTKKDAAAAKALKCLGPE